LKIEALENSTKENMMEIAHLKKPVSNNETKEKFKCDKFDLSAIQNLG
jgi:hypothetical protein